MTPDQGAILGLIQGLTEFLPVSSSGHLVIGQTLFRLGGDHLTFDVLVHGATLLALVVYFRRRLITLFRGRGWEYLAKLAVASLPVVLAGATLYPRIERAFTEPFMVAGFLALTGVLLLTLYLRSDSDPGMQSMEPGWAVALAIGVVQALALLPGISRSGSTIVAGMWLGLAPAAAAEFSFLLAIPAIAGAIVYESQALWLVAQAGRLDVFLVGGVTAFGSALLAIGLVLRTVGRREFRWLGFYCLAAASLFGLWLAMSPA